MEFHKGILLLALIATPCLFSEGCGHGGSARVVPDGGQPLDEAGQAAGDVAVTPGDTPQLTPPLPDAQLACSQGGCDAPPMCTQGCDAPVSCVGSCDAPLACPQGRCDAAPACVGAACDARPVDARPVDVAPVTGCAGVKCSGHGTCTTGTSGAVCKCDASYHAEGLECIADPIPPPIAGKFTDIASSSGLTGMAGAADMDWCFSVTVEDIDGDAVNDVFIGNHGDARVLAWNDGTGKFTKSTEAEFPATEAQTWIDLVYDFDNDGLNDVSQIWDSADFGIMQNKCVIKDGKAIERKFISIPRGKAIPTGSNAMAWSDWDGDGDLDYMLVGYQGSASHPGTGNGTFSNLTSNYGVFAKTTQMEPVLFAADLTGDDLPDLLMQPLIGPWSAMTGHTNLFAKNTTTGTTASFSNVEKTGLEALPSTAVALGDIDNDGDLDVFGMGVPTDAINSLVFKLFRNDSKNGEVKFTDISDKTTPFGAKRDVQVYVALYFHAAFIDVNGDKFLDILFSDEKADRVFLNKSGSGEFVEATSDVGLTGSRIYGRPTRLSVGDLTGDHIPDFITIRAPDKPPCGVQLFRNDVSPKNGLMVKLVGKQIKNAVNSKLTLYEAKADGSDGDIAGYREVLLSTTNRTPLTQHFALPDWDKGKHYNLVAKFWPSRTVVRRNDVKPGKLGEKPLVLSEE
jgi:hypothetical protein